jgi:hypothetical protein
MNETDPVKINALHRQAEEYGAILTSVQQYADALAEEGWGKEQGTEDQLKSVARHVGLAMPKIDPEMQADADAAKTGSSDRNEKA